MLTNHAVGDAAEGVETIDRWAPIGETAIPVDLSAPPLELPPDSDAELEIGSAIDGHDADEITVKRSEWLRPRLGSGGQGSTLTRRLMRLSGMVCAIAGIALAVVLFSTGSVDNSSFDLAADAEPQADEESSSATTIPGADESSVAVAQSEDPLLLALAAAGNRNLFGAAEGSDEPNLDSKATTSTTGKPTTTVGLVVPEIGPESEWVDSGNGVRVPDLLLRIRFCESTNNYKAAHVNSSARGAYQFISGSWRWYGFADRFGVASADLATPAQQDQAALDTLNRDGTRPWNESKACWASPNIDPRYATAKPKGSTTTTTSASTTTTESSTSTSTTEATTTTTGSTTSTTQATTTTTASTTTTQASSTTSTTAASSSTSGG